MQSMTPDWQTWSQPQIPAAFAIPQESKLKLSLEQRNHGGVIIVHCQGRIVYRDEAVAFSRLLGQLVTQTSGLVVDLSGVTSMDSAGIGELALLQSRAQDCNVSLKYAGANSLVRDLLELTNLDSVLEIHDSLDEALDSFREEQVWAD
jgi:anti-sigma B factor antagonist